MVPTAPAAQSFRFAVINDLHYMDADDRPWLEGLVRQINQTPGGPVEICLVLGDLAEKGTAEELAAAADILAQLKMPWHVVPGNHDGPAQIPVADHLRDYDRLFPNCRNYTFEHKGWQFLALDTCTGNAWKNVALRPETVAFAKHAAATLDPRRPTIAFTHFPLGAGIPYALVDGLQLLDALAHLNLPIIFSGHYHALTHCTHNTTQLVTNRCCSQRRQNEDSHPHRGYLLCTAQPDGKVGYTFTQYPAPITSREPVV